MSTPNEILNNSRNELLKKKEECEAELRDIENAINGLDAILLDADDWAEDKPRLTVVPETHEQDETEPDKGKSGVPITLAMVRDAVVYLGKHPPEMEPGAHAVDKGWFTQIHVVKNLGYASYNQNVVKYLTELEEKGTLQSKPYKSGKQYRYIPPQETGPGAAAQQQRKLGPLDISTPIRTTGTRRSQPVAGTGGRNRVHCTDKDVERLIHRAEDQGYKAETIGSGHIFVTNGNGKSTTISSTGNSSHLIKKVRSDLQKIGVNV